MACPGSSVTSANFLRRTLRICPTVQVATSDSSVSSLHGIPLVARNPGIAGGNPAGPTLRDPIRYPAAALAALYRRRWQIERNFDDLKTSLGMNHFACQSTDMALRLVTMDQCAYNLIRALMQQSAHAAGENLQAWEDYNVNWSPGSPHNFAFLQQMLGELPALSKTWRKAGTDLRKAEKNLRKFARMVEDKCMGWYVAATGFFPPVCMK